MQPILQSSLGRVLAWRHAILAFPVCLLMAVAAPANAGSEDAAFDWTGTYAGIFAGSGRADNRIVDVEGFANWGNPGWTVDYGESEFVGGALIGRKLDIGGLPLRIEFDGTFGRLPASSNKLDPEGLDETVDSKFRWIATARGGMDHSIGPATVFAVGGLAVARIDNSVTDVDFGPGMPTRVDPDDSFRDSSTEVGWTVGLGIEAPLTDTWTLRLEGSYLEFGGRTHYVNRLGDARCGPDKPRRPCPYEVENELGIMRLAVIRRFGP